VECELSTYKNDDQRLASYKTFEVPIQAVKLARYGFRYLGNGCVECVFGANVQRLDGKRFPNYNKSKRNVPAYYQEYLN